MNRHLLTIVSILMILIWQGCGQRQSGDSKTETRIPARIDFNFHVRPLLSDRCYACHGPDENTRKGNLRLDIERAAFAALDSLGSHFAIVPGDLEESSMIDRITSDDPSYQMPPPESNLKLNEQEINILKRWIEQGAEWKPHWAFQTPKKTTVPQPSNMTWVRNPIDNFILNRLEQEGLRPSDVASKEKLIRRLSFDLRGLPPTLNEINAFVSDQSPNAYEHLVDQFLSETSYGERMAMEWMDLARYADSHGYQDDIERSMWPWRDWVIEAFNANMPYDEFVSLQLAGDLHPNATYQQKLATGFNRNHKITQEVGVIDEEYRVTYVLDRVNTFSTAFLGLTIQCAQCHDHKYDPISQEEYYSLFSFFNSVPEKGRVDYGVEVANPSIPLPEEKIEPIKKYVRELFANQQEKVEAYSNVLWQKGFDPNDLECKGNDSERLPKGLLAWYPLDFIENELTQEAINATNADIFQEPISVQGKFSGGLEFMGKNYARLSPSNTHDFSKPFSTSFWIKSLDGGIRGPVLASLTENDQTIFYIEVSNNKDLRVRWYDLDNKTNLQVFSIKTIPENKWVNIVVTHDGSRRSKGVKLYMNGEPLEFYTISDKIRSNLRKPGQLFLASKGKQSGSGFMSGQLDEIMLFDRELTHTEVRALSKFDPIDYLMSKNEKSISEIKRLFYHQLSHLDKRYQELSARLVEYKIREGRTEDIVTKPTMVMADLDEPRPTYVLNRGQYDDPGSDPVTTETPEAIMAFDPKYPKNRLGLAQWLFDSQNPLSARVAVNRCWQMIFGRGIVATPEDFGSQGSLPSHPELLDWLAVDFQETGWDTKNLIKTMVMSATYRQTVNTNNELQQVDPDNILLARGAQMRLPAEMIRDHALTIAGLITKQVGGPSVKPYQPEGLWLEVASGNQSLRKYIQDHGTELYRRSLYTFWKRTMPPPSMTIFDAPAREECTVRRTATSTPMQALVLLNDPQFIEASRMLAIKMMEEGGEDLEDRIFLAFRLATSRSPNKTELNLLKDLFEEEKSHFEGSPEEASNFIAIGELAHNSGFDPEELAAYTVLANTILNMTETILKG